MNIDSSTGLYFYSALLQADAAVLAIVGLYITFKLQTIQLIINNLRERITAVLYQPENEEERVLSIRQLTTFDESLLDKKIELAELYKNKGLLNYLSDEIPYHKKLVAIKKEFIAPSYLIAILISLNIIGIIFSSTIHVFSYFFEIVVLVIVGLLHIFMFFLVVTKMKSTVVNK